MALTDLQGCCHAIAYCTSLADKMELHCRNLEIVMFLITLVAVVQGQSEYENCTTKYSVFEEAVFKTNDNLFKLTTTFYPPDKNNPLYVNVTYKVLETNTTVNYRWSSATLYHIIPPRIIRYLSLLFCYIEDNRIVDLELELPEECEDLIQNHSNTTDFILIFTQRVMF